MNKTKIGIILSLLLLVGLTSCGEERTNSKIVINEVLTDNQSNFQDDYGVHSAWIELFNKSYGSVDLAAFLIKVSSTPGDTATYFIPKGDVLTIVKPRQHALFWADGEPNRGTFHIKAKLNPDTDNWVGLYNSGKQLIDEVCIPAGKIGANQSYARISDGANEWEVKGGSEDKYVTPSTNNLTINNNAKKEKFEEHDGTGIGMAITAMSVVFFGLLTLFVAFMLVGKTALSLHKRNIMQRTKNAIKRQIPGTDAHEQKKAIQNTPGEVYAAIALAMHEMHNSDIHDVEETIITINRVKRSYSPWSSKIYTLRETPHRK